DRGRVAVEREIPGLAGRVGPDELRLGIDVPVRVGIGQVVGEEAFELPGVGFQHRLDARRFEAQDLGVDLPAPILGGRGKGKAEEGGMGSWYRVRSFNDRILESGEGSAAGLAGRPRPQVWSASHAETSVITDIPAM